MQRTIARAAVCFVSGMMLHGCSGGDAMYDVTTPPGDPPVAVTTFHKDVEPIVQQSCQGCHVVGGLAPFPLTSYQSARAWASQIATETGARRMPPWGAQDTSECKPPLPWQKDARLAEKDIATIAAWVADGAVEGDPKDAPPPRAVPPSDLPGATLELAPKQPFTSGGKADQFRCFVLEDPRLEAGAFVTGIHVIPGNKTVVHHAVVVTDPNGEAAMLAGPDGSFECSSPAGGTPRAGQVTLEVWTPGYVPIELPSNMAMPVVPGSKLIMQIHYSPGGRTAETDLTHVQLRLTTTKPDYLLFTTVLGNASAPLPGGDGLLAGPNDPTGVPEFFIPRETTGHTESMQFTLPPPDKPRPPLYIYGVMAHEHLAGVDMKIDLAKAASPDQNLCLLQDRWDFHWQRMYAYDAPVSSLPTLDTGDKIRLRCTYDNTMQNPRLRDSLLSVGRTATEDIHLGESTLDEMCLVLPQVVIPYP
jgi:Copper type II ascorbate-dependent monooxygenase, C-terminal domain